ncbi:MAG: hypothetical protein E7620_03900 [Ruminococcaceae bacterium]|nr:hypothetical protein [Oscillospiraceae bacterium]
MRKLLSILLLLALMLTALASCGGGTKDPTETEPPVIPPAPITLFAEGATGYTIVRAENASNTIVQAGVTLRSAFLSAVNVEFPLCDEYMYELSGGTVAIVIGETTDPVTTRLKSTMQYDDFVLHVENGNLYLIGGSDRATEEAVKYFIEAYVETSTENLVLNGDMDMRYIHEYALKGLSINGTPIASYRIVYDNARYYSKALARDIRDLIVQTAGVMLEMVPDTTDAVEHEIIVGAGLRPESLAVEATYEKPHLNYTVKVQGSKLVVVNQGVRTGEEAFDQLEKMFEGLTAESCDVNASNLNLNGDILKKVNDKALARADGTNLRFLHSNVLLATTADNDNGYTDQQRAELLVDTYLVYSPDVITFNEMIEGRPMTGYVRNMLSEYYTFIKADYLALFGDADEGDANAKARNYATPIAYRKDCGLTPVKSGFNYLSDMISYHGASWTVFDTPNGNRFVVLSGHFSENKDADGAWISTFSADTIKMLNVARREFGDLPVVLSGDWFAWQGSAPYQYFTDLGFVDASEKALKQHSVGIGTYHTVGQGETGRVEEDITFYNPEWFKALSHKNLVDFYTVNGSDHYPVLVDMQFVKSATPDDIPPYDDGTGDLNIKDEGAGGSGEWGTDVVQNG